MTAEPNTGPTASADDTSKRSLDTVRADLRQLGYLDDRVERYLLQDALKPERPAKAVLPLTAKFAALVGVPVAIATTLALAVVNGHLRHSPFDLIPLFLHLLPLIVLALSAGFLVLSLLFVLLLQVSHIRRIESASLVAAALVTAGGVAFALAEGRAFLPILPRWQTAGLALLVPAVAWAIFHGVHGALLALAIRLTDRAPEQPSARGRWVVLGLVAATFLGMLPAVLDAGRGEADGPSALPSSPAGPAIVIGVDGILPEDVDYLLASGELPTISRLADEGAVLAHRRSVEEPIAFWATIATGLPSPLHGMDTVDTFRPIGLSRPLRRVGALRHLWSPLASLGLVEYRPVLANNRRAWAFWELASRGGAPALVVGWWGTFPVEPSVGTSAAGAIVAHGAHTLLVDGIDGAVYPPDRGAEIAALARQATAPAGPAAGLRRVLGARADAVIDRALLPDRFQLDAFRLLHDEIAPRTSVLYLPAVDIANDLAELGSVARGELVRWQLANVDALLAEIMAEASSQAETPAETGAETLVLVFDPGRRGATEGRTVIWRRAGCGGTTAEAIEPTVVASGILRALGLPQSRELPPPPAVCQWPGLGPEVATYGVRRPVAIEAAGAEYLESLKALGYL